MGGAVAAGEHEVLAAGVPEQQTGRQERGEHLQLAGNTPHPGGEVGAGGRALSRQPHQPVGELGPVLRREAADERVQIVGDQHTGWRIPEPVGDGVPGGLDRRGKPVGVRRLRNGGERRRRPCAGPAEHEEAALFAGSPARHLTALLVGPVQQPEGVRSLPALINVREVDQRGKGLDPWAPSRRRSEPASRRG